MADDDVPVCDILCEAMEYLSKLGSNLRTRSDILKEKRIRKDKLKNTHAVQKAANKVLLICELSKKSLENVETGVKKILKLVDASQARARSDSRKNSTHEYPKKSSSDGGKGSNRESPKKQSSDRKREVHYIRYKSQKLRISKKISLKHYASVKVQAAKMSTSFIEKYPVYYDCKLYRLRMKKTSNESVVSDKSSINSYSEQIGAKKKLPLHDKSYGSPYSKKFKPDDKEEVEDYRDTVISESLTINKQKQTGKEDSDQSKIQESAQESESRRESKDKRGSNEHKNDSILRRESEEYKNNSGSRQESKELQKSCESKRVKTVSESKKESKESDSDSKERQRSKTHPKYSKNKKDKRYKDREHHKSQRVLDSSSDDDQNNKPRSEHHSSKAGTDICDSDDGLKKKSSPVKKNVSVIDLSSDEDESKTSPSRTKKIILPSDSDASNDKNHDENPKRKFTSEDAIIDGSNTQKDHSDEDNEKKSKAKPLIKCVSLTKLLKPNVLEKVADKTIQNIRSKQKTYYNRNLLQKKLQKEENDVFWASKRKEVKAFKAKEFRINVVKLPKFTAEFLKDHSLKMITQNNKVVFELENQESAHNIENVKDTSPGPGKSNNAIVNHSHVPMDEIKNALLNDSDSESSLVNSAVYESENAKNTLLDDSNSENNDAGKNDDETNDAIGSHSEKLPEEPDATTDKAQEKSEINKAEVQSTICEKTPEKKSLSKTKETDIDLAKSSLLASSNPVTPKTPLEKRRRSSKSVTPSKRKPVMESMNAKKMLLSSSSSEEELPKVSSDKETVPKLTSRRQSSSDSEDEEELLKRVNKKRKVGKSIYSDSDVEKSDSDKDKNGDGDQSQNKIGDEKDTEHDEKDTEHDEKDTEHDEKDTEHDEKDTEHDEKDTEHDEKEKSAKHCDLQEGEQDSKLGQDDNSDQGDAADNQSDSSSSKVKFRSSKNR